MNKLRASNANLAEMVEHMIRLEPENRLGIDEYLQKWRKAVFPPFFGPLHDLLGPLMTWAQDHSVLLLKASFSGFLTRLQRKHDPEKYADDEVEVESLPAEPPGECAKSSTAYDDGSPSYQLKRLTFRSPSPVRSLNSQHAAKDESATTSIAGGTERTTHPVAQTQPDDVRQGVHMHSHCDDSQYLQRREYWIAEFLTWSYGQ
jgi:hypothetical protein